MVYEEAVTPTSPQKVKKIGRKGKPYVPIAAGDGVAFDDTKIKPEIMRRIEALGVLNDRRVAYVAAGDGESLLKLADEYEAKKMPVMAETVRKEAYEVGAESRRAGGAVAGAAEGGVHGGAAGAVGGVAAGDARPGGDP